MKKDELEKVERVRERLSDFLLIGQKQEIPAAEEVYERA